MFRCFVHSNKNLNLVLILQLDVQFWQRVLWSFSLSEREKKLTFYEIQGRKRTFNLISCISGHWISALYYILVFEENVPRTIWTKLDTPVFDRCQIPNCAINAGCHPVLLFSSDYDLSNDFVGLFLSQTNEVILVCHNNTNNIITNWTINNL